jgi:hypothetical protein
MKIKQNHWEQLYEARAQANQLYYVDFDRSLSLALKCVGKLEKQEAKHLSMIGHLDVEKYVSPFYELVRQSLYEREFLENERKKVVNQDNINYENNPYTNHVVDYLNSNTNIDPIEPTTGSTGMNTKPLTFVQTRFDSFKDKLVMSTKKRNSVEPLKITTHDDMNHSFTVSEHIGENKAIVIWEIKKENNRNIFDAVRFEVRCDSEKEIISIGNHARRKNAYEFKFYYGDDWKSDSIVNYMLPQKFFTLLSELGYKGIWIDFPIRWVDMIKNETTKARQWTIMVGE